MTNCWSQIETVLRCSLKVELYRQTVSIGPDGWADARVNGFLVRHECVRGRPLTWAKYAQSLSMVQLPSRVGAVLG